MIKKFLSFFLIFITFMAAVFIPLDKTVANASKIPKTLHLLVLPTLQILPEAHLLIKFQISMLKSRYQTTSLYLHEVLRQIILILI